MRIGLICGSFLFALIGSTVAADQSRGVAAAWQSLTRIDAEAAYELLANNHPAALPQVDDKEFTTALAAAHTRALARAETVTSYDGYLATLAEFANSMGDGHIASRPTFQRRNVKWAGIIAAKRGGDWVVGNDDPKVAGQELAGARIASCDGVPIQKHVRQVMPFHVSSGDPGFEVVRAGWILIDDGNPFVTMPKACTFSRDGRTTTVALNWTEIALTNLLHDKWKDAYGQAGFGVRAVGHGYWIAIQELTPKAQPVIDAARAQIDRIRKSAYVVIDFRGNGGGDDAYGRALAEIIYGPDYVESVLGPKSGQGGCTPVFRASDGNIEAIAKSAEQYRREGDTAGAKGYSEALVAMKAARAEGRALTGPLTCADKTSTAAASKGASSMRAPVFLLTDHLCFSSCIESSNFFRQLGASQVGVATGADTHFSEVRRIVLPSGLSTFSTLQAIETGSPRKEGPYEPKYPYPGDIADTAALEKWISDTVLRGARKQSAH
jgi:hypothetical protein